MFLLFGLLGGAAWEAEAQAGYQRNVAALDRLLLAGNDEVGGLAAAGKLVVPAAVDDLTRRPGMNRQGPLYDFSHSTQEQDMYRKALLFSLVLTLLGPALAMAQRFELTPFVGYRLGGSLDDFDAGEDFDFEDTDSLGVVLSFAINESAFIELFYSRQETGLEEEGGFFGDQPLFDVDIDYWHVGGLFQWNIGQVKPFVVASLGITEFDPQPEALSSETRFSAGIGGGAKFMFGDHFGFRLEGRGFTTFVDNDNEAFCDSHHCYGYSDTTILWQLEARVGLVLAF